MPPIVRFRNRLLYKLLLIIMCIQCNAFAEAQGNARIQEKLVTLSAKGTPLSVILKRISKSTGITIYFNNLNIAPFTNVTLQVKNKPFSEVLRQLLDPRGLDWVEVNETTITIRKAPDPILSDKINISDTTISVSGKVLDDKGDPIEGATVLVKGSRIATSTKNDGTFTINYGKSHSSIIISSISFTTQEIPVNQKTNIGTIILKESISELDETQVIAYGQTTRRLNTGNVSTVKAKDIAASPVSNPLLAVQGRVPGIFIEQASGLPGTGVKVRIQGQNSLAKGNDPLYVVDGIAYVSQLLPSINNTLGTSGSAGFNVVGNPLNFINPLDIESIEILKDADATSIYGSRAAAGAILITTKKGKSGDTKFTLNMQSGFGKITRKLAVLNTKEYIEMRREAYVNDGLQIPDPADASQVQSNNYDLTVWDQNRSADWQKELIGGTAKYTNVNASMSGGTNNTTFLIGTNYKKETTVLPGDLNDQKASVHLNVNNTSVNKRFRANIDVNYMFDENKLQVTDLTGIAIQLAPNAPKLKNNDGSLNWANYTPANGTPFSTWDAHPLTYQLSKYRIRTNNLVSNLTLSYEVLPGLNIKSNMGYTSLKTDELSTTPNAIYAPEYRQWDFAKGSSKFANNNISSWTIEPQITYQRSISRGRLETLLGTSFYNLTSDRKAFNASGYSSDLQLEDIKAAPVLQVDFNTGAIFTKYRYSALFARINYNWDDKYIFNATFRNDGSSRFGSENQFHTFGSVAGAWIFSEEPLLKKLSFLSFGKLRISYGTTGNDQIDDYSFLSLYNSFSGDRPYLGGNGLRPQDLPNPYLQWEETRKFQPGAEFGFLKNRILVNATYFLNRSSNQLLSQALPGTAGRTTLPINLPAKLENSGWEFSLNIVPIQSKVFTWSAIFNLTTQKNRLVEFPDLSISTYKNDLIVGEPVNLLRKYRFSGVDPNTGLYQFTDSKGVISSSMPMTSDNQYVILDPNPRYYGGIQNSFSYKRIQLNILLQFAKQIGQNYLLGNQPGRYNNNQPITVRDRWQKAGDVKDIQRYSTFNLGGPIFTSLLLSNQSDITFSDASYIRVKNIDLSWQLPDRWLNAAKIASAKIYFQAQNLLTITGYEGMDPENRSITSLPPLKVLTFGFLIGL
jgi:TonB-linked SusC/RagA family outer membrane protein